MGWTTEDAKSVFQSSEMAENLTGYARMPAATRPGAFCPHVHTGFSIDHHST